MQNLDNIIVEPVVGIFDGTDVGFLDGDVEPSIEESGVEITAHQEGTNVLDMIRTGKKALISLTFKETTVAKITELLGFGGGTAGSVAAVVDLTCVADVGGSLNNKYFFINTALNALKYLVWLNVNGQGVAPSVPVGFTAVEVDLATNASASAVADAVAAALDALAGFVAPNPAAAVVTITYAQPGVVDAPAMGDSGFSYAITTAGSSALVGWGSSKDFTSQAQDAKTLVLRPVRNQVGPVKTGDLTFWKAYPNLKSISYSGENPKLVKVDFSIFPDLSKPAAIRLFAYGDVG